MATRQQHRADHHHRHRTGAHGAGRDPEEAGPR